MKRGDLVINKNEDLPESIGIIFSEPFPAASGNIMFQVATTKGAYIYDADNLLCIIEHNNAELFNPEITKLKKIYPHYFKFNEESINDMEQTQNLPIEINIDKAIKFTAPRIEFDIEKIITQVNHFINPYKGLIFTDDKIIEAKEIVAKLNKFDKAISDRRIALTKEIKVPIDEMDQKIKLVCQIIKDAATNIKLQIDDYAVKKAAVKKAAVEVLIAEGLGFANLRIKFATMITIDAKYLLESTTLAAVKKDLILRIGIAKESQANEDKLEEEKQRLMQAREKLISNLNAKYGLNATYSMLPIDKFNDEMVAEKFKVQYETKLAKEESEKILQNKDKELIQNIRNDKIREQSIPEAPSNVQLSVQEEIIITPNLTYLNFRVGAKNPATVRHVMKLVVEKFGLDIAEIN